MVLITKHRFVWRLLLVIGTIMYGMYSPLVHLCQVDGRRIPFSSASLVLLIELLKLLTSAVMYFFMSCRSLSLACRTPPSLREVLPFAVPASLYAFNNNASVWMQSEMDPTTFQVLGNLKILVTALLYRIIMKRALSRKQWLALGLLLLATTADSASSVRLTSRTQTQVQQPHLDVHITITGIGLMAIYCFVSGFASVYNEYIMKDRFESSIHLQNLYQYSFGVLLNGIAWSLRTVDTTAAAASDVQSLHGLANDFLTGFSSYTWLIVFTQVFCGLLVSVILKHSDSIARLFLICFSMLVTTASSAALFSLRLSSGFVVDAAMVMVALALYLDVLSLDWLHSVASYLVTLSERVCKSRLRSLNRGDYDTGKLKCDADAV